MIRYSVEDHEAKRGTLRGKIEMAGFWLVALPLLPLAALNGLWESAKEKRARKDRGACIRCGHAHAGDLLLATDAHGWTEARLCRRD